MRHTKKKKNYLHIFEKKERNSLLFSFEELLFTLFNQEKNSLKKKKEIDLSAVDTK